MEPMLPKHAQDHYDKLAKTQDTAESRGAYERIPKIEGYVVTDEIKRLIGFYELMRQLRYRQKTERKRLESSESRETFADHLTMSLYLCMYFLPIINKRLEQQGGTPLSYERVSSLTIARNLAELNTEHSPTFHKSEEFEKTELISSARLFHNLPVRNGFAQNMADNYAEYLEQKTLSSRFAKAVKYIESMFYILTLPDEQRRGVIAGNGFTQEDYDNFIYRSIMEFPELIGFYSVIKRLFVRNGYFANEGSDNLNTTTALSNDAKARFFREQIETLLDKSPAWQIKRELQRLAQSYRLKRKLRYGFDRPGHFTHPGDSVAQHTGFMLLLNRYFYPIVFKQNIGKLEDLDFTILAHDISEAIVSDQIGYEKSDEDKEGERRVINVIVKEFSPKAGGMQNKLRSLLIGYETTLEEIKAGKKQPGAELAVSYIKAIDSMEALLHLFEKDIRITRAPTEQQQDKARQYNKSATKFFTPFPELKRYYDAIMAKFEQEGIY